MKYCVGIILMIWTVCAMFGYDSGDQKIKMPSAQHIMQNLYQKQNWKLFAGFMDVSRWFANKTTTPKQLVDNMRNEVWAFQTFCMDLRGCSVHNASQFTRLGLDAFELSRTVSGGNPYVIEYIEQQKAADELR